MHKLTAHHFRYDAVRVEDESHGSRLDEIGNPLGARAVITWH
jgi:hypothetical protein